MSERTILITGCSTGIGRSAVEAFVADGWQVAGTVRSASAAADLATLDGVLPVEMDVTDPDAVAKGVAGVLDAFGHVDALVNNAGASYVALFEESPEEAYRALIETNLFGVINVSRAVVPHMRARGTGTIVNVTSLAGIVGAPLNAHYSASKWAVEGMTEALLIELAPLGIRMKLVQPGATRTAIHSKWDDHHTVRVPELDEYRERLRAFLVPNRDPSSLTSSEQVAAVIVQAVTDGTDRLRYAGDETVARFAAARRELDEDGLFGMLRERFFGSPAGL